jgi:hypothetical protein
MMKRSRLGIESEVGDTPMKRSRSANPVVKGDMRASNSSPTNLGPNMRLARRMEGRNTHLSPTAQGLSAQEMDIVPLYQEDQLETRRETLLAKIPEPVLLLLSNMVHPQPVQLQIYSQTSMTAFTQQQTHLKNRSFKSDFLMTSLTALPHQMRLNHLRAWTFLVSILNYLQSDKSYDSFGVQENLSWYRL